MHPASSLNSECSATATAINLNIVPVFRKFHDSSLRRHGVSRSGVETIRPVAAPGDSEPAGYRSRARDASSAIVILSSRQGEVARSRRRAERCGAIRVQICAKFILGALGLRFHTSEQRSLTLGPASSFAAGFFTRAFLLPGGPASAATSAICAAVARNSSSSAANAASSSRRGNAATFDATAAIFDAEFWNGATSGTTLEGVHARTRFS